MTAAYRVEFSPEALGQVQLIASCWASNRPAAPKLFHEELAAAVRALEAAPAVGVLYEHGKLAPCLAPEVIVLASAGNAAKRLFL